MSSTREASELGRRLGRYGFVAPALAVFLVFFVAPTVAGLVLSLFSWGPLDSPEYVGTENYRLLFTDPQFLNSLKVTLIVVGVALVTQLPSALVLALLLSRPGRWAAVVRIVIFLPMVLSLVAVALLWKQIFRPGADGLANRLMEVFGLGPVNWFGDTGTALWTLMIVVLWSYVGFHTVIQLSGLSAIPGELLEAARLDTRSERQVLRHVTLPLMRESLAVSATLIVTSSFAFLTGLFFVMTKGGPARATEILGIRAYIEAFQALRLGMANAVVSTTLVLTLLFVGLLLWIASRNRVEY